MAKITVKSGKGKLSLSKSTKLVGVKVNDPNFIETSDAVHEKVLNNLGGFQVVTLNKGRASLDKKLDELRLNENVDTGTHVYVADGIGKPIIPTGDILIDYALNTSSEERKLVLDEFHLELVEQKSPTTIIARVTKDSPNPLKVAAALQKVSLVNMAEPDLDAPVDSYEFIAPNDSLYPHEWHLLNTGILIDTSWRIKKGADARVVDAWKRLGNTGSKDITIAVIDIGFDTSHPDLKDKIVQPYDLWNHSPNIQQGDTRFTHGTPCASVALATANGKGIVGAAPNAKFMPLSGTSYSWQATEEMFNYCIDKGADIISCSWGTVSPEFALNSVKEAAIAKAAAQGRNGKGCVILYAAGNEGMDYVNYYAAHPDVICVGASTSQDEHADYSNKGKEMAVVAPSNGDWPITAARAWWDEGNTAETGDFRFWADGKSRSPQHKHFGGTSSATPLVAGICALVLSANPDLTAKQVKDILCRTADKIGAPSEYNSLGHSVKYGYGRVNADKAVQEALRMKDGGTAPTEPPVVVENQIKKGQGIFRFNVVKQPAEGFGIQIGAYYEYGNVLIQVEKLQSAYNVPIIVSINELDGKTVYKIVVGAFANSDQARNLGLRMKADGITGFVRNLKDLE